MTVTNGDSATFRCLVRPHDANVHWFVNGQQIAQTTEKYKIVAIADKREMTIKKCTQDDCGEIKAGMANLESTAELKLKRK